MIPFPIASLGRADLSGSQVINTRKPKGDMQSGSDRRIPKGDMQSGTDVRRTRETL